MNTPPQTPQPDPTTAAEPTVIDAKPPEQTSDEKDGFAVINPPIDTYVPRHEGGTLRGIILGRAVHPMTTSAFYIVLLTEPCEHYESETHDEGEPAPAGSLITVWETLDLMCMHSFAPRFATHPTLRNELCQMAWEIKLQPYDKLNATTWRTLCKARQITQAAELQPVKRPPPFPSPHIIRTREQLALAPAALQSDEGSIPVELAILARIQEQFSNMTAEQVDKVMKIADTINESPAAAAPGEGAARSD